MSDPATTEVFKIFGVEWPTAVMAGAAILSFVFSVWSYWRSGKAQEYAKRSAGGAEKSADEAEKSRKLVRFNALADHFMAIDGYISAMKGERKIGQDDLYRALSAIDNLSAAFAQEKDFVSALSALKAPANKNTEGCKTSRLENCKTYKKEHLLNISGWAPKNLPELENTINQAKARHLNIG